MSGRIERPRTSCKRIPGMRSGKVGPPEITSRVSLAFGNCQ